jgi:hypothetical protein
MRNQNHDMAAASRRHAWCCHSSGELVQPVCRQIKVWDDAPEFIDTRLASAESVGTTGRAMPDNVLLFRPRGEMLMREVYLLLMMEMAGMTFGRGWRGYY